MRVSELCPSPHLEALDCGDNLNDELVVTIRGVAHEIVGSEKVKKGVVFFDEHERGFVLNKTNSRTIASMFGSNTDEWVKKRITIYRSETSFQGRTVPCIRVRDKPAVLNGSSHSKDKVPTK